GISEITADHPEVQAMVEEAMKSASVSESTLSPQIYAEVLEGAIAELMKNKDRFPGAPEKGGWVVDNYPLSVDHWSALSEKRLLPDTVICLKHTETDDFCILCLAGHQLAMWLCQIPLCIGFPICKIMYEISVLERKGGEKHLYVGVSCSPSWDQKKKKIALPKFVEDAFPDTEEMNTITKKIEVFMHDWQTVESEIKNSSLVQVVVLEIAEQTPESLLNQTVLVMEKPFKYHGWELSAEDLAEEAEDLAAEAENEVDEEEVE
ncbi:KAD9 kinase, partial [Onychorhynchus coronatus]|nr:KAD9 kinase [Onychorhynchus coronatus]